MGLADRLKQIFDEIANSAKEASSFVQELKIDEESVPSANSCCICIPKTLPKILLVEAARLAAEIRPDNAPKFADLNAIYPAGEAIHCDLVANHTSRFWERNRKSLSVSFHGDLSTSTKSRILEQMNVWNSKVDGILFQATNGVGEVRISMERNSNWSYIGTDVLLVPIEKPTTNFDGIESMECERTFAKLVQHHTGHLLGFSHAPLAEKAKKHINMLKLYQYMQMILGWDKRAVDLCMFQKNPEVESGIMTWQLPNFVKLSDGFQIGPGHITDADFLNYQAIYTDSDSCTRDHNGTIF